MKKNLLKVFSTLFIAGVAITTSACGGAPSSSSADAPASTETPISSVEETSSEEAEGIIKSLTANKEVVEMKIEETLNITSFYKIEGFKALSAANKQCTYTSSNEEVVKISSKSMKAVALGEATITVTSKADETKSCSFKVTVSDVYFDRTWSSVDPADDFSKEMIEDGGVIETKAQTTGAYFIKEVNSTVWSVKTDLTVISVASTEKFPKFGVCLTTTDKAEEPNNGMYFFLNAEIANVGDQWDSFGITEVNNSANWAWNPGVPDNMARHADHIYTHNEKITYNTKVTMEMIRDGYDFHFLVNGSYVKSAKGLTSLFGNVFEGGEEKPIDAMPGFFQFNSHVRFENYSYVNDEAAIKERIASFGELSYVSEWNVDAE